MEDQKNSYEWRRVVKSYNGTLRHPPLMGQVQLVPKKPFGLLSDLVRHISISQLKVLSLVSGDDSLLGI